MTAEGQLRLDWDDVLPDREVRERSRGAGHDPLRVGRGRIRQDRASWSTGCRPWWPRAPPSSPSPPSPSPRRRRTSSATAYGQPWPSRRRPPARPSPAIAAPSPWTTWTRRPSARCTRSLSGSSPRSRSRPACRPPSRCWTRSPPASTSRSASGPSTTSSLSREDLDRTMRLAVELGVTMVQLRTVAERFEQNWDRVQLAEAEPAPPPTFDLAPLETAGRDLLADCEQVGAERQAGRAAPGVAARLAGRGRPAVRGPPIRRRRRARRARRHREPYATRNGEPRRRGVGQHRPGRRQIGPRRRPGASPTAPSPAARSMRSWALSSAPSSPA